MRTDRVVVVVEDDRELARALVRGLQGCAKVELFEHVAPAKRRMSGATRDVVALVVDVALPDGSGLSVAEAARKRRADLPILVITGDASTITNHQAFRLRAQIVLKPFSSGLLRDFVQRALAPRAGEPPVAGMAAACARAFADAARLSEREHAVLALAMQGATRSEMATRLGITEGTVKTMIARLLRKTECRRLNELVAMAWCMTPSGSAGEAS